MTEGDKVGYEFFVWDKYGEASLFFTLAQTKKAYKEFREYQKQQQANTNDGEAFIVPKPDEFKRVSAVIDDEDDFIDDETLLHIYDAYDWEKEIYEHFGFDVNTIETGREEVLFDDLQEE
jgi:hypothetical protein